MDLETIRQNLADRYPQWARQIGNLRFEDATGVSPVDNDGRTIYYNSRLMRFYTSEVQCFYLAQQLMHLQLAHHARGAGKDRRVWKRASDAVVNRMLKQDGFQLPEDAPLPPQAEEKSAEELYALLYEQAEEDDKEPGPENRERPRQRRADTRGQMAGAAGQARDREIEDPGLAAAVEGLRELLEPSLQLDYDWFPGDTVRHGVIPYRFKPYPVAHAEILLDTSASVDADMLRNFVRGVKGLWLQDAVIRVGCFDTRFYGFQEIRSDKDIDNLVLRGSGGTNFTVAINAFTGDAENQILFTDGYAEMPEQRCDAVWVVYGNNTIQPKGGRVLYVRPREEKEKHEIDFLIT